MRFYVNNCCVEIKYSFLLIIAYALLFKSYDFLFVILFSALHEIGHLLALSLLKCKADRLVIAYYGIGLRHSNNFSNIKSLVFLSAGVLVNLVFVIANVYREINLSLLIVNSLPIYPLDGGRILKLLLNSFLNLRVSDLIYRIISVIVIVALISVSLYLKSISLILIIIYVIVYSVNNSFD